MQDKLRAIEARYEKVVLLPLKLCVHFKTQLIRDPHVSRFIAQHLAICCAITSRTLHQPVRLHILVGEPALGVPGAAVVSDEQ